MANFNKDIPKYDVTKKNSGYNYGRLRKVHQDKDDVMVYFSDYKQTGKWLRKSKKLRKALDKETQRVLRSIKRYAPSGEGNISDAMKARFISKGGHFGDRMAFHLYVTGTAGENGGPGDTAGDQFLTSLRMSQFTEEAWKKRMSGKSTSPSEKSWMERALDSVSLRKEGRTYVGSPNSSRRETGNN